MIQMRQYMRLFTLEHLKQGINPVRLQPAPNSPVELFCPAILQFRYKEKVSINGATSTQWSDWQDANFVTEQREAPANSG